MSLIRTRASAPRRGGLGRVTLASAAVLLIAGPAAAADRWWVGYGGVDWAGNFNWANANQTSFFSAPGVNDVAVFGSTTGGLNTATTLGPANYSILGLRTDASQGVTTNFSIASSGGTLTVGAGGITHNIASTFTISAPMVSSGPTTINAGTLQIGEGGTTGSISGNITNNANLAFNRSNAFTYTGNLSGNGTLTKLGPGTLTLSGNNTYSGGTTIAAGTLALGSSTALPVGGNVNLHTGTLNLATHNATIGNLVIGDGSDTSAARTITGTGTLTVNGNISFNGRGLSGLIQVPLFLPAGNHALNNPNGQISTSSYDLVFSAPISGSGGLSNGGTLFVALTAPSTYTGPTVINSGRLHVATHNALPTSTDLAVTGGILRLNPSQSSSGVVAGSYNQTVGSLSGTGGFIDLGSATLTVNQSTDTTYAGVITGVNGKLTKSGSGTLSLTGNNAYTGRTSVFAGTLRVNNAADNVILGSGGADVHAGATLVFDYAGGVNPVASVRTALQSGFAGNWLTGQIISTTATSAIGLGYFDDSILSQIIVKPALYGDTDLDGSVGFPDLLSLAQNYGTLGTGIWSRGDFNCDNNIDFGDLLSLAQNYNNALLGSATDSVDPGASFRADWAMARSLVPEPTTLALLVGVGVVAMRRR